MQSYLAVALQCALVSSKLQQLLSDVGMGSAASFRFCQFRMKENIFRHKWLCLTDSLYYAPPYTYEWAEKIEMEWPIIFVAF